MALDEPCGLAQRFDIVLLSLRRFGDQHLERHAGERAGRHHDQVPLARKEWGDGAQHQVVEGMGAIHVEALHHAGAAAGSALRILLG